MNYALMMDKWNMNEGMEWNFVFDEKVVKRACIYFLKVLKYMRY